MPVTTTTSTTNRMIISSLLVKENPEWQSTWKTIMRSVSVCVVYICMYNNVYILYSLCVNELFLLTPQKLMYMELNTIDKQLSKFSEAELGSQERPARSCYDLKLEMPHAESGENTAIS